MPECAFSSESAPPPVAPVRDRRPGYPHRDTPPAALRGADGGRALSRKSGRDPQAPCGSPPLERFAATFLREAIMAAAFYLRTPGAAQRFAEIKRRIFDRIFKTQRDL